MSDALKQKVKFITGYQSSLMIKATKGDGSRDESNRNYYNTKQCGDEFDAWSTLERIGLAKKKSIIDGYYTFKLTHDGLLLTDYMIELSLQGDAYDPF